MSRAAALAVAFTFATGCAAGRGARAGDAEATLRTASVDYQRALLSVCEGKAARAALKSEFDEKQEKISSRKHELDSLEDGLEAERATMSDAQRRDRRAELDRKAKDLNELFQRFKSELADHERAATRRIFDRMSPIAYEIWTEGGYASLREGKGRGPEGSQDITDELVTRYDARFPVAGCASMKTAR